MATKGPYSDAFNEISIANLALGYIGSSAELDEGAVGSTIPTTTLPGRACARHYNKARVAVLMAHDWDFARVQQALGTTEDVVTPPEGWAHTYKLPDGTLYSSALACIAPRQLWSGKRIGQMQKGERIPFEIWNGHTVGASSGHALVCDFAAGSDNSPFLYYTGDVRGDVVGTAGLANWPTYFIEAVGWALAARIAPMLTQKQAIVRNAMAMAKHTLLEGIALENNLRQPDPTAESEFITSRE